VEPRGNALADPQGEFTDQNILYVAQPIEDVAARTGRSAEEVMAALARARQTLFDARAHRPRPHLDDKVITAWNGLMIAAFARAARTLVESPRRDEWRAAAVRAATWVREHLWRQADRRLYRRHRDGESAIDAFCEDYAYLAWGLIELFQTTGDDAWLVWAREVTEVEVTLFHDARDGGWFSTTGTDRSVLLRVKEDYDGAEPAAASVTVRNLITLGHLLGDRTFTDLAARTLERYGPHIGRAVRVMPLMVANIALWHGGATQVVVAGPAGDAGTRALEAEIARQHMPWAVTIPLSDSTRTTLPWLKAMAPRDGHATAYVCSDFTCQAPVTEPAVLREQLEALLRGKRVG